MPQEWSREDFHLCSLLLLLQLFGVAYVNGVNSCELDNNINSGKDGGINIKIIQLTDYCKKVWVCLGALSFSCVFLGVLGCSQEYSGMSHQNK